MMTTSLRSSLFLHRARIAASSTLLLAAAACGGGESQGAPDGMPPGGMPPTPVTAVTLVEAPIERVSDFVATVKSRQSTTIQPQAEGFITRIAVTSGRRVAPGDLLFEIDAAWQQAGVASLQSVRAAREAEAALARQQVARAKTLYDAGAVSLQELEQAQAAEKAAEAQLKAVDEQIRQQQTELGYYRVVAPMAGVVGDIPVRVGDRVTRATVLTTVEDNSGLELYINVPVQDAPRLSVGLPVRILAPDGAVVEATKTSFVAPSVDEATQTVLVKAPVSPRGGSIRADQFVKAQLVWGSDPGLTVPVTAITRVGGLYFAFVVEQADGGLVARQRPVTLGTIVGDSYVLTGGVAAGERLIVAGTQKIFDGAPVDPQAGGPPPAGGGPPPAGGAEQPGGGS